MACSAQDGSAAPLSEETWAELGQAAWLPDGSGLLLTARKDESDKRQKQLIAACEKDRPGTRCQVSSFFRGGQYQLTELLLLEAVDRRIFRLLNLPGYRRWCQEHRDRLDLDVAPAPSPVAEPYFEPMPARAASF